MPPHGMYLLEKQTPRSTLHCNFMCSIFSQETAAPSRAILPFAMKSYHLPQAVKYWTIGFLKVWSIFFFFVLLEILLPFMLFCLFALSAQLNYAQPGGELCSTGMWDEQLLCAAVLPSLAMLFATRRISLKCCQRYFNSPHSYFSR